MKTTVLIVMLIATPVFAQSRVYTNADLGKPLVRTRTVTPEELESLRAHQFVLPHEYHGPTVTIMPYDDSWSRTPLSPNQPLDPNWRSVSVHGYWSGDQTFLPSTERSRHQARHGRTGTSTREQQSNGSRRAREATTKARN
jgi:hypothetical protein